VRVLASVIEVFRVVVKRRGSFFSCSFMKGKVTARGREHAYKSV